MHTLFSCNYHFRPPRPTRCTPKDVEPRTAGGDGARDRLVLPTEAPLQAGNRASLTTSRLWKGIPWRHLETGDTWPVLLYAFVYTTKKCLVLLGNCCALRKRLVCLFLRLVLLSFNVLHCQAQCRKDVLQRCSSVRCRDRFQLGVQQVIPGWDEGLQRQGLAGLCGWRDIKEQGG